MHRPPSDPLPLSLPRATTTQAKRLIKEAERIVLTNASVRGTVGEVFAGGNYEISFDGMAARGWYSAALPGNIRARVFLDATRDFDAAPWDFRGLRLEVDREALEARAAGRRAVAVQAGYHKEVEGGGGQGDGAAAPSITGNVPSESANVIVFQLRPVVEAPVEGEAAGKTELR
jgi:hypothetical protein